jgi:predicted aspartyl protease
LYVRVNFEHSQGRETARALIDSGATENFVDIRTAERWKLPRKTLPNPRSIINVDGTDNKAGAVTEACVLEVLHEGDQQLQRFSVTDLGFNRVLLGYPWLHGFNPQIDWKKEGVEGEVTLKTITNAWEKWRDLRRKALVASVQVNSTTVDETEIRRDMCTMWGPELTMIEEQSDAEWGAMIA